MSSPPKPAISASASRNCSVDRWGNSSTPEGERKALKPNTPASHSGSRAPRLDGMAPPQKPTSTRACGAAAARLSSSASTVVVGGMLLSGMSTMVVTPPAAAARVPVVNPSHSVRPGSFTCTCESTMPGTSTWPGGNVTTVCAGTSSSNSVMAATSPSRTSTVAGRHCPSTRADSARRARS